MTRIVYLNGEYVPAEKATVSIFDRGILFADAIYEVAAVLDGKLLDMASHLARLDRSLGEMRMAPIAHDTVVGLMRELVRRNGIDEGLVYLQITRGSNGDRDFLPSESMTPTVFAFAQHKPDSMRREFEHGLTMVSAPDIRWARRDIKTVGLMGSVFAKWAAKEAGAQEVLMHEDGIVTEGGATSFFIVRGGTVVTRPLSDAILHGCTRRALIGLAEGGAVRLEERMFTLDEARGADEAFLTGASTFVTPVVRIDDAVLGDGRPGPVTRRLQGAYLELARREAV